MKMSRFRYMHTYSDDLVQVLGSRVIQRLKPEVSFQTIHLNDNLLREHGRPKSL